MRQLVPVAKYEERKMSYDFNDAGPQSETAERYEVPLTDEERAENELELRQIGSEERFRREYKRAAQLSIDAGVAFVEKNKMLLQNFGHLDELSANHENVDCLFTVAVAGFMQACRMHFGDEEVSTYLLRRLRM
jgi:hypothetical protein